MAHVAQVPYAPPLAPAPGLVDTLRSELTKLRTLRATFWSFVAAVAIVLGLGALIAWGVSQHPQGTNAFNAISASWGLGQLAFLVLGVMTMTNEYSSGLVTNTFLATPKRSHVLVAKAFGFTAVTLVVAEVMSFANFFIEHGILSSTSDLGLNFGISGPNVVRSLIGTGIYAALIGLMGMGLGTLLRHTAGAIVVGVAIMLVLPALATALPNSWSQPIGEYWPTEAGRRVYRLGQVPHTLTAWWGAADLLGFVVVLLIVAGWFMNKRDA